MQFCMAGARYNMIIAVDGPTAAGKGTIARAVAEHFRLPYLDTGLLYRAVGRQVEIMGGDPDNPFDARSACSFPEGLLDNPVLRTEAVGGLASRVSVHPQVREALMARQRDFAHQAGGAVLDGRDIGTVIVPDADVKLFVTASAAARVQRRFSEMRARGVPIDREDIAADIAKRDARDSERASAPLMAASDAIRIDTTLLSSEEAIATAIASINMHRRAAK